MTSTRKTTPRDQSNKLYEGSGKWEIQALRALRTLRALGHILEFCFNSSLQEFPNNGPLESLLLATLFAYNDICPIYNHIHRRLTKVHKIKTTKYKQVCKRRFPPCLLHFLGSSICRSKPIVGPWSFSNYRFDDFFDISFSLSFTTIELYLSVWEHKNWRVPPQ